MSDKQEFRVVVLGLGRFGTSVALELVALGTEVMVIDSDPKLIQRHADDVTHAVVADTTDAEVMRQLGVDEFQRAVVGIGTNLEASILTTAVLVDLGVPDIFAKAISREHGRILERIGAHHVVLPEHEMGERVAHVVAGRVLDYIEIEDDYAMIKARPPQEAIGKPLGTSKLRAKYGVTVVGVKRPAEGFTYATAETVIESGDVLIIAGKVADVERLANRT
ncbi:trk system potassium uptake protein TrkA [Lentzea albidocapillata subsp. violacea]|uniref:Trk system potassium uptake protein TrkA n=1 Tax=Lentzea albidocapillata subsp. violacea TaxID=128104 RepID=A0A1G8UH81_9PSEU|nr:TrkA family potassium uptake protein [Lentzea albidocapillata]SDJ52977.1 trk system potassium uptake protein TrkA [Lentzea albidocapillata subsp. violacea]